MGRYRLLLLIVVGLCGGSLLAQAATSIEIDLEEQRAYLLRDGEIIHSAPIASGRIGYETTRGTFKVVEKSRRHYSNLYGSIVDRAGRTVIADASSSTPVPRGCRFVPAAMPYFMRFNGAEGMHAGILPGGPASHGCVRLPRESAAIFFAHTSVGTPVTVFGRTASFYRVRGQRYARQPSWNDPRARAAEPRIYAPPAVYWR